MVEVQCTEELLTFDFTFPTTPAPPLEPGGAPGPTGTESVFQILHQILTGSFKWEEDAFERAKQGLVQQHEQQTSSMEGAATEQLLAQLVGGDARFLSPGPEAMSALTLADVRAAVTAQLDPANLEISVVGDLPFDEVERCALTYVGTVDGVKDAAAIAAAAAPAAAPARRVRRARRRGRARAPAAAAAARRAPRAHDARARAGLDPRAVAYPRAQRSRARASRATAALTDYPDARRPRPPAGAAAASPARPRRRAAAAAAARPAGCSSRRGCRRPVRGRRRREARPRPAAAAAAVRAASSRRGGGAIAGFGAVALSVLQEVINRRLFSVVREREQLTYDANFNLMPFEKLDGAWTSSR